jgi:hypothetical protein
VTDEPDARQLLEAAREAVRIDLLGALPADRRYPALMVANAIAIALRELGERPAPDPGEAADRARLAREIRAGAHDGAAGAPLHAALTREVMGRLAISNPRDPRLAPGPWRVPAAPG